MSHAKKPDGSMPRNERLRYTLSIIPFFARLLLEVLRDMARSE
jgi:hypothetical protein